MHSSTALVRRLAVVAIIAQALFVLSWLLAGIWQRRAYNWADHSISDMYAVDAPAGLFLVTVLTLCGIAVVAFALWSLWPALRAGGWPAAAGSILLALSIFGLGDVLSPFEREACQLATPGCTASDQTANLGGRLDSILSTFGVFALIAAGFLLAEAMTKVDGWQGCARITRWGAVALIVIVVATVATQTAGVGGLFERLLAAAGAAGIALLALQTLRVADVRAPSTEFT